MTEIASTDAPTVRLVAPDGSTVGDVEVGLSEEERRELLRLMIRSRRLDRECLALQRQGELTVYPPFEGQEAAQVGSAFALGPDDFVFPSFRELAAAVVRGVDVVEYLEYHRGTWHGGPYDPIASRFAPICVPVATQIVHAVGWAMGARLDGSSACSLTYFGDGSASEGDFHEGANLAGVFRAPTILFCQNNGWAISVPSSEQFVAPIAARAAGYGMPGVRVDGNDVLAVYAVTRDAVERARAGEGPTLIEAVTYRIGPTRRRRRRPLPGRGEVTPGRARPDRPLRTHRMDGGTSMTVRKGGDGEARNGSGRARRANRARAPPAAESSAASRRPAAALLRQREELLGDE